MDANVFNTFSFNKWAEHKREEEIDRESKKRRIQQIKRLKEQLYEERRLRELKSGDGDLDLEALIEAIQSGEAVNIEPVNEGVVKTDEFGDRTDDDILAEIRAYQDSHNGRFDGAVHTFGAPTSFIEEKPSRVLLTLEGKKQ